MLFLRCVGEALAAKGLRGLMGFVPLGEQIYDISEDAINRYQKAKDERRLAVALEEVVQAGNVQVQEQARLIAAAVTPDKTSEETAKVGAYLAQVAGHARQSLRRPQDPAGKTVPKALNLEDPHQLAAVLPRRAPRFSAGELVPHAPQWRFVELLGSGGFGEVWLTCHTFLDQRRAVKFCLDAACRDRLLRHEGEVVKRVMQVSVGTKDSESGIVPLVDAYLEGEAPWLAYEYIEGGDLATLVREYQRLSPAQRGTQAVRVLRNLASIVGRFHRLAQPVIHRDIKPANILLKPGTKGWLLRVTDFGIGQIAAASNLSRATVAAPNMHQNETFRGAHTPIYASPQQKRGMKADVRDDVHALGLIGYQLLLADLAAERPAGKWRKRVAECGLSEAVLDLLESCWDDDPEERPKDAMALAEGLDRLKEEGTTAAPGTRWADVDEDYRAYLDTMLDPDSTTSWLKGRVGRRLRWAEAAGAGHEGGAVLWGRCLAEGVGGGQDHGEAMAWFRQAADKGDAEAMNHIGRLYGDGEGVERDDVEAMAWYRKAAERGSADAMKNVGGGFVLGNGVREDYVEAMAWYRKAAAKGHSVAMVWIGLLLQKGWGVERDYVEAMAWHRKAAARGNRAAMYHIGSLFQNGWGVEQDYGQAMVWYRKAAAKGSEAAMHEIGLLFQNGLGVKANAAEADRWFQKAREHGWGQFPRRRG